MQISTVNELARHNGVRADGRRYLARRFQAPGEPGEKCEADALAHFAEEVLGDPYQIGRRTITYSKDTGYLVMTVTDEWGV